MHICKIPFGFHLKRNSLCIHCPLFTCSFFFFAKFKYNWTVHLILLFGPNLWRLLCRDRKEGDHIKKQFVLFLAELSTMRNRIHRVQMALNESVFMCWSRGLINVCLARVRLIALFIITFIQLMQVNSHIHYTPQIHIINWVFWSIDCNVDSHSWWKIIIRINSLPLDNIYGELYFKDFSLIDCKQITWQNGWDPVIVVANIYCYVIFRPRYCHYPYFILVLRWWWWWWEKSYISCLLLSLGSVFFPKRKQRTFSL